MKPLVRRDADGVLRTDDPSAALERLALFEQLTSDLWAEQEALSAELDGILRQNLMPRQAGGVIENDATDAQGDPVLFAYLLDLPRILRFDRALELQDRQGTVICFDFQAEVLRQFCCKNISFEVINLQKYERGILHQA